MYKVDVVGLDAPRGGSIDRDGSWFRPEVCGGGCIEFEILEEARDEVATIRQDDYCDAAIYDDRGRCIEDFLGNYLW